MKKMIVGDFYIKLKNVMKINDFKITLQLY